MQGVFPAGELDALQDVEQALAPGDPGQRNEWLFARQLPELGDNRRFSDPGYETALRERRNAAVAEVGDADLTPCTDSRRMLSMRGLSGSP